MFAGIEGTRPLLVEIQALVAPTTLGTPRRAVVGWDQNRLSMVLAVLEAHCGVRLSGHDVYLNVAGGLRIQEPAADVAAAAALVSSLAHAPLPADAVYFGEVSLSGAVRPVAQTATRLKEAQKLGFTRAIVPEAARATKRPTASRSPPSASLASLVADIARDGAPRAAPRRPSGQLTVLVNAHIQSIIAASARPVERMRRRVTACPDPAIHPAGHRSSRTTAALGSHEPCRSRCSISCSSS